MKNKKHIIYGIITVIILIVLYFIPIRSFEYIKYENPMDDGGPLYRVYYNIYNIEIRDEKI